jgi:ferredoxin
MKTHAYQKITGAVKNQFGCIVGLHKAAFHVKRSNPASFARMLLELNAKVKPRLYVMDGIMAMEGNGPRGGDARKMNCIIISTDAVALDTAFCKIIGLNPLLVPVIRYAKRQPIEYVGDPIESFVNKNFNVDRHPASMLPQFIRKLRKPVIDASKCVRCGLCVKQCPVKALSFKDKKKPPVYDYKLCIRCYCCQEVCPSKAIAVKSFFRR